MEEQYKFDENETSLFSIIFYIVLFIARLRRLSYYFELTTIFATIYGTKDVGRPQNPWAGGKAFRKKAKTYSKKSAK
jgi:hypothetical protein